jgi:hypothetical protein
MRIRDIVLAAIIIALLVFTYIPVEEAEEQGGAAFGTMKKTEQPIPAAAE